MTYDHGLSERQLEATKLIANHRHVMLYGGSRSGKTWAILRSIAIRALTAPSTHAILRHRFNHLKHSIVLDSFPAMMRKHFANVKWTLSRSDWYVEMPNGSRIVFGGLDDKERTEKILGQEHSTLYFNEASQISYKARVDALTRLAQNSGLVCREIVDCNPPSKGWWGHKLFVQGIEPLSGLPHHGDYVCLAMQPSDNPHLSADYLAELDALPSRARKRYYLGEFSDDVQNALWTDAMIDNCRIETVPELRRIVVAIDPSGCSGAEDYRSDEVGIVVCGSDGQTTYVLEDATGRYSPRDWARRALEMRDKWGADSIVAEKNYGGAMVASNIRNLDSRVKVKEVTASRGKHIRAEPVAGLYEQGRVKHVGRFHDLEQQLLQFSTHGYEGDRSPDRADAVIWGITELTMKQSQWGAV